MLLVNRRWFLTTWNYPAHRISSLHHNQEPIILHGFLPFLFLSRNKVGYSLISFTVIHIKMYWAIRVFKWTILEIVLPDNFLHILHIVIPGNIDLLTSLHKHVERWSILWDTLEKIKIDLYFLRSCQRALIKMPSWGNKNKLQINNSFKFFARGKIHLKLNFYMAISCIWKHFTSYRNQKKPIQLFVSKLLTYYLWMLETPRV